MQLVIKCNNYGSDSIGPGDMVAGPKWTYIVHIIGYKNTSMVLRTCWNKKYIYIQPFFPGNQYVN